MTERVLVVEQLGRRPYGEVLELQRAIAAERIADGLIRLQRDAVAILAGAPHGRNLR